MNDEIEQAEYDDDELDLTEDERARDLRKLSIEELKAILDAHSAWLRSDGNEGKPADLRSLDLRKANLSNVDLSKADLSGANLHRANLQNIKLIQAKCEGTRFRKANLREGNLRDADFRDAHLRHANLEDASLYKANIAGAQLGSANLSRANLYEVNGLQSARWLDANLSQAKGLKGAQFAGTDITGVALPPDIAKFDALDHVAEISKHARNIFLGVVGACVYSWLTIATTTDAALVAGTHATPLPIINTPVPITGFYWAAPLILLTLYLYLHLYLQRMWEGMAELPAVFPDGRSLDRCVYPWLLSGFVCVHVPRLKDRRPPLSWLQVLLSVAAAWGMVPFTIFLFWGRYLVRHDWIGTLWHVILLGLAVFAGLSCYRLAAMTLRGELASGQGRLDLSVWMKPRRLLRRSGEPANFGSSVVMVLALLLSFGAIEGSPNGKHEDWRAWLPSPTTLVGYRTFAVLHDAEVSVKPSNWTGLAERPASELAEQPELRARAEAELAQVKGAQLTLADLRNADGLGVFLAKADLQRANLTKAKFIAGNLQQANLRSANLEGATLASAKLQEADLHSANLRGADLGSAKLHDAELSFANLRQADLFQTDFTGATLRAANLQNTRISYARFQKAKLWGVQLVGAVIEDADFREAALHDANLRSAVISGIQLEGATLTSANFQGATITSAKFHGATLKGADFRGAAFHNTEGLTQAQLDEACGDETTELPPGLTIKPCPEKNAKKTGDQG